VERLVEDLTRGNVTEVKVVLATVIVALAVYQLVLAAVSYGKARPRFLESGPATWAHRASGDTILVLAVLVAIACVSFYGFEDGGAHAVFGCLVLAALALKVLAVRIDGSSSPFLPWIGIALFGLFAATWLTSAGGFLGVG
jgi:small-conductance mechanosensitive channel